MHLSATLELEIIS